jgi:hypothetical protein
MKQTNLFVASVALIALTLGVTSRADTSTETEPPLPPGSFIIADEGTAGIVDDPRATAASDLGAPQEPATPIRSSH